MIISPARQPAQRLEVFPQGLKFLPPLRYTYGPGIFVERKDNCPVGPWGDIACSFRASTTSTLDAIRWSQRWGTGGYSGGTGGSAFGCSVQADSAGLPSGTALSSITPYAPGNPGDQTNYDEKTFVSPATLTRDQIYWIVFHNGDASPTVNFNSINAIITWDSYTPRQPALDMWTMAVWTHAGGGGWETDNRRTPVMDLTYGDGSHDGQAYHEAMIAQYGTISGTLNMVRERFTVSAGEVVVSSATVRVRRTSGTSPLTVRLETGAGVLMEAVDVPAASVAVGLPDDLTSQSSATVEFSKPWILSDGATYNLRLSCAAGTTYTTIPSRKGTAALLDSYHFADGTAQRTTDGTNWAEMYAFDDTDLQFYFV